MKTKFLILSDLHIGESRGSTTHDGIIRQANSQAEATLLELLPQLIDKKPDLTVHLGDAIRDVFEEKVDSKNLTTALTAIRNIGAPSINTLGNHEVGALSLETLSQVYTAAQVTPEFYGTMMLNNLQIVWLDFEMIDSEHAQLSDERLEWLSDVLSSQTPTIIFSHFSVTPIDETGSFYFVGKPKTMHYQNYKDIQRVITSGNVKLCINAHVHLLSQQKVDGVTYISNPAFSENIAAEQFSENNPGIYSVLEIDEDGFVFTSYSGQFCFAKIQEQL